MDTKKINFLGFWKDFDKEHNMFTDILREKFDVQISDDPDFLFVSPLGEPYEYTKYTCVKILFTGEPLAPDFNVFDYAIGFDSVFYADGKSENRYYRYPFCFYDFEWVKKNTLGMSYDKAKETLAKKKYFCSFLYGHRSAKGERERVFSLLQEYKRVESAGSFMNNMPDGKIIPYSDKKIEFLKECKFTVAVESISYPGFITEKIRDPFIGQSVPIYYGNPLSLSEFNPEAMINLHAYDSFEEGIEKVIEIDKDDEKYIKMLMAPKMISESYMDDLYNGLKEFLIRIFSQDKEHAYRRMREYIQAEHDWHLEEYNYFHKALMFRVWLKLFRLRNPKFRHGPKKDK